MLYFRQRDANACFLKVEDGYSTEEIKQAN